MLHWNCTALAAGCPASPPAVNSSCSAAKAGLVCDYGFCMGGERVICQSSKWQSDGEICPG